MVLRRRVSLLAWPPYHFYPVPAARARTLFDETYRGVDDPFPDSQTVCLFARECAAGQSDAAARENPHPDSFIGRLLHQYGL